MSKLSRATYSEPFKLEVLRDYYSSGLSVIATAKKWGLKNASDIHRWKKCYTFDSDSLSLPCELVAELQMKKNPKSKEELLEEENLRLRKALELEKLRSYAFKRLIDLAEKEEGISILKKDGAK